MLQGLEAPGDEPHLRARISSTTPFVWRHWLESGRGCCLLALPCQSCNDWHVPGLRRFGLVVLAAVGLLPCATPAGAAAPPFPAYVDAQGTWIVNSNSSWHVSTFTARARVIRAHSLGHDMPGEKASDIWAPTCQIGRQTVIFTREVDIPGTPSSATFTFDPSAFAFPMFESADLVVNGRTLVHIPASALLRPNLTDYELTKDDLKAFRGRTNALRVVVTKTALPASAHACNTGSLQTMVAAAFTLQGYSAADLSVTSGKYTPVTYVRGSAYTLDGVFTIHNAGPSAAFPGQFVYLAQIGFLDGVVDNALSPITASAPFGECTSTSGVVNGGRLSVACPFDLLPAGASARVHVRIVVKIPADESPAGIYDIDSSWSVNSLVQPTAPGAPARTTRDPNSVNNTQTEIWNLCGPQATDQKCPK
jgi:hypothetical protein